MRKITTDQAIRLYTEIEAQLNQFERENSPDRRKCAHGVLYSKICFKCLPVQNIHKKVRVA